jgi:hypothetical protein
MQARCSRCGGAFAFEQFGPQRCPHCGAETVIEAPPNPYAPPVGPVGGLRDEAAPRSEEPIPWEQRREIGRWTAFRETVNEIIRQPAALFERMRTDSDEGAFAYYCLVMIVPASLAILWSWSRTNIGQVDELARLLPPQAPGFVREMFGLLRYFPTWQGLLASMAMTAVGRALQLVIWAGLAHVFLALLGMSRAGWTATFKTFAYASTPGLLYIVPACGAFIGFIWIAVLSVIGLSRVHRIGTGSAIAAVLTPALVPCLAACVVGAVAGIYSAHP